MGSTVETNDTLQITKAQGFSAELNFEKHQEKPISSAEFKGKIFEFEGKTGIRVYHAPPVCNFLVENINGKWLFGV